MNLPEGGLMDGKYPGSEGVRNIRVLIVDDDPLSRNLIKLAVELQLGLQPLAASSGREALEVLRRERIHIVVTDFCMPEMSGLQVLQTINSEHPGVAVIVLSSSFEAVGISPDFLVSQGAAEALTKDDVFLLLAQAIVRVASKPRP